MHTVHPFIYSADVQVTLVCQTLFYMLGILYLNKTNKNPCRVALYILAEGDTLNRSKMGRA